MFLLDRKLVVISGQPVCWPRRARKSIRMFFLMLARSCNHYSQIDPGGSWVQIFKLEVESRRYPVSNRQNPAHLSNHRLFNQFPVNHYEACIRRLERAENFLGMGNLTLRGRENLV